MRILIVTDAWAPQVNGVVFTLEQTRRHLIGMGHSVDVIHPGLFSCVPCPSYREIRLAVFAGKTLARLIREHAPDALHIATEGPLGLSARRHAMRRGLPFTTAYHTRFPEYVHARTGLPLSMTYRWLRWFHGPAARTMVPTDSGRRNLLDYGFDAARVVTWARGVDASVFRPGKRDADAIPAARRPLFLYAGRVAVEKNIEAFLALDLPGDKYVVGDGPARAGLMKRYPDAVFTGAQTHAVLAEYYRKADVFVFPSQTDTFGLVLLEAMACGCPVAALPSPATEDILGASGAGVISADLHSACMRALAIDRRIPERHAGHFSWEATTMTFLRHLQPIARSDDIGAAEAGTLITGDQ